MADSQVLNRLDFPAYCIKLLDNGLVALTGGGGMAKTGVGNSIVLGFINYSPNHQAEFKQIHKFDSEDAIMKFVSFTCEHLHTNHSKTKSNLNDLYIAAAVNQSIEIYKVEPCLNKQNSNSDPEMSSNLIQRKKSTSQAISSSKKSLIEAGASIKLVNTIKLSDSSDVSKDDSIATVQVYKSKQNKQIYLCAGTSKGHIHVWSLQFENNNNIVKNSKITFEKLHEFKQAHTNEIDDLQISSDGVMLSIGKDSKCFVWSLEKLSLLTELNYLPGLGNDTNLRIKHARFSSNSDFLYTTYIPRIRGGLKNMSSYIQRWSRTTSDKHAKFGYKLDKTVRIRSTILTCVQVSKDGLFVSAGDCDGKIYLYDFEFNKLIDFKKQHSSVITDLVFYYDQELNINNLNKSFDLNKFILTISIDRTLQLYKFLNVDLTNRFLFDLTYKLGYRSRDNCSKSSASSSLNSFLLNTKLINLFTMNLVKFIFILFVLFLLFCYFFTYIE